MSDYTLTNTINNKAFIPDFVIITYNDTCDKDCLILTHKP
jgi:hypothetical protein